ncbi:MAG: hypothetical protein ACYC5Q_16715 [Thermoleophilia bacterium]
MTGRHLVRTDRLDTQWGRVYDRLFENRQRGDYQDLVSFDAEQVAELRGEARGFVRQMLGLLEE